MDDRDGGVMIWWLSREDYAAIGEARPEWPEYLRDGYESREGRPGRGRLWVPAEVEASAGRVAVAPWPDTPLGSLLGRGGADYGGIVLWARDAGLLAELPGYLTDARLRRAAGPAGAGGRGE